MMAESGNSQIEGAKGAKRSESCSRFDMNALSVQLPEMTGAAGSLSSYVSRHVLWKSRV